MPLITDQRFDTIVCIYVLNVVTDAVQREIVADIAGLLAPGGIAYYANRKDIIRGKRGAGVWQRPARLLARSIHEARDFVLYAARGAPRVLSTGIDPPNSPDQPHRTAMARSALSAPMRLLHRNNLLRGTVLDYGCGHGFDADELGLWSWDPHYRPDLRRPGANQDAHV